jgi:hypothetical protein
VVVVVVEDIIEKVAVVVEFTELVAMVVEDSTEVRAVWGEVGTEGGAGGVEGRSAEVPEV